MFRERQDQLFSALLAHVQISFIALFLALMIAVPLGIQMTRRPNMAEGLISLSAVLQTRGGTAFPQMKTVEPEASLYVIETGDIQLVDAYSTDSELRLHELVVPEDDKHLFPHYQGVQLRRSGSDTAKRYPERIEALNRLQAGIRDDEVPEMNYRVNAESRSARDVAKQFLAKAGLR